MLKHISNLGTDISKDQQKKINGGCPILGNGGPCYDYFGPLEVTCEQFYALSPQHQQCVDVAAWCFDY